MIPPATLPSLSVRALIILVDCPWSVVLCVRVTMVRFVFKSWRRRTLQSCGASGRESTDSCCPAVARSTSRCETSCGRNNRVHPLAVRSQPAGAEQRRGAGEAAQRGEPVQPHPRGDQAEEKQGREVQGRSRQVGLDSGSFLKAKDDEIHAKNKSIDSVNNQLKESVTQVSPEKLATLPYVKDTIYE